MFRTPRKPNLLLLVALVILAACAPRLPVTASITIPPATQEPTLVKRTDTETPELHLTPTAPIEIPGTIPPSGEPACFTPVEMLPFAFTPDSAGLLVRGDRGVQIINLYAVEYLANRQNEAWRNHLNGYCQQALIEDGISAKKAEARLKGLPAKDLHELMFKRGFNLATTPAWQRRGIMVYKKITDKEGFNPITRETVIAERSAVTVDRDLPLFTSTEGKEFLEKLVTSP